MHLGPTSEQTDQTPRAHNPTSIEHLHVCSFVHLKWHTHQTITQYLHGWEQCCRAVHKWQTPSNHTVPARLGALLLCWAGAALTAAAGRAGGVSSSLSSKSLLFLEAACNRRGKQSSSQSPLGGSGRGMVHVGLTRTVYMLRFITLVWTNTSCISWIGFVTCKHGSGLPEWYKVWNERTRTRRFGKK